MRSLRWNVRVMIIAAFVLVACSTVPVTGRKQLDIIYRSVFLSQVDKIAPHGALQAVAKLFQILQIPVCRSLGRFDFNSINFIVRFKHQIIFVSSDTLVIV